MYMNGKEIFRRNVEDENLDEDDEAINIEDEKTEVTFIFPIEDIDYYTLAVELHKYQDETNYPIFDLSFVLLDEMNKGCINANKFGDISSYYPKDKSLYNTDISNVFSNDINKYWSTELPDNFDQGDNINIIYEFNSNHYFIINELYLRSGGDENYEIESNPKSLTILGHNKNIYENENINLIDINEKYLLLHDVSDFFNNISINIFQVNDNESDSMNINKIEMLTCSLRSCPSINDLPNTIAGNIVDLKCKSYICLNGVIPKWKEIHNECEEKPFILSSIKNIKINQGEYINIKLFEISGYNVHYEISPKLPDTIKLTNNGYIQGNIYNIFDELYNIRIYNDYGETNHSFIINVIKPEYPVIEYINEYEIIIGKIYENEPLIKYYGDYIDIKIEPKLPKEIQLSEYGLLNGVLYDDITQKYLIKISNSHQTINVPILIKSISPKNPYISYLIDSTTLYYGEYKKLRLFIVSGENLTLTANNLPNGLSLNENGFFTGKLCQNCTNPRGKMTIDAETNSNKTSFSIGYELKYRNSPTIIELQNEYEIMIGKKYENIELFKISGEDNSYYISSLPNGLSMDSTTGFISGYVKDEIKESNHTVTVINMYGRLMFNIHFTYVLSDVPLIIDQVKSITYIRNIEISPIYLVLASGKDLIYSIKPDLPKGIYFIDGIIYGIPEEVIEKTEYTVYIQSNDKYTSAIVELNVISLYCEKDGVWERTEIGKKATRKCEIKGEQYRYCNDVNGNAEWGEIIGECEDIVPDNTNTIIIIIISSIIGFIIIAIIIFVGIKYWTNKNRKDELLLPN